MRLSAWKLFWVLLLPVLFLMPPGVFAQKQPEGPPPGEVKKEQPSKEQSPEVPGLAEFMVKGNELSKRLTVLKTKTEAAFHLNPVKENLQAIEARLERFQAPIERRLIPHVQLMNHEAKALNFSKQQAEVFLAIDENFDEN